MLDVLLFLKASGIGFAIASAGVGPMSLLCMRTTLTWGWRQGLAIGFGIAIGDGIYAAIAALGVAGLSAFMLAYEKPLHIAAGLFLIYLGLRSFRSGKSDRDNTGPVAVKRLGRDFATSIFLTLTNPPTIIMFAAVFTALAPEGGLNPLGALTTVAGVVVGSLVWWGVLVALVSGFRHAIGRKARSLIDWLSGVVLAALGLVELRRGVAG